jgi:hypothetical protein
VPAPVVPGALRDLWQPVGSTTMADLLRVTPQGK